MQTIPVPVQETWVRSLGREDPLKEEMQQSPLFLPGKFHRQRSLTGYSPWNQKESEMMEHACTHTLKRKQKQEELYPDSSVRLFYFSLVTTSIRIEYCHVFSEKFAYDCVTALNSSWVTSLFSNAYSVYQAAAAGNQRLCVIYSSPTVIDFY